MEGGAGRWAGLWCYAVGVAAALAGPVQAAAPPADATVQTCFSPGPESCAEVIATAVDSAQKTILVQAYWLTSLPILHALAAAQRRGVDVQAVLDRSQDRREDARGRYTPAVYLVHAGVRVWIDDTLAIAHSKVMVLDGATVITGSFNFTHNADTRNGENVVVIQSPEVARRFTLNWSARRAVSRPFEAD